MSYNPNEIYQALVKAGDEFADVKSAYRLLDSMTKPQLSEAFRRTPGASATERRELMFSDELYVDHLTRVAAAYQSFLIAEVRYRSMQALADAKRTEASNLRAEAQYVGMQEA
ncbi:MAG: hypothetical protein ACTSQA_08655 [Candidatus Heimdallarchaeaceae archaeon]